jgi:tRNA (cmo5U34)-methyltransferase
MNRDEVFKADGSRTADFEFDDKVAGVFDDMVQRSVPYYAEQQRMIGELSRAIWIPGTTVYDLGASTATTLMALSRELPEANLVGYDNSRPMIEQALVKLRDQNLDGRVELRSSIRCPLITPASSPCAGRCSLSVRSIAITSFATSTTLWLREGRYW